MADSLFQTFSHIGQYGTAGYQALPRMMAMSQPLHLWAPASWQLAEVDSRISVTDFIDYVDEGYIRIHGRQEWLLDPSARDPARWPNATWDKTFDGAIKRMCEEDAGKPRSERRVLVAPPERGWQWAEKYLDDHPHEVERWSRLAKSKRGRKVLPKVTLEEALRHGTNDFGIAQRILRDAHNHGNALSSSGARTPFYLSVTDRRFLQVLNDAPGDEPTASVPTTSATKRDKVAMPEVAAQLIDVLRVMDIASKHASSSRRLKKFMHGEGHNQLVSWISSVCAILESTDARTVDGAIINYLRDDLSRSELAKPIQQFLKRTDEVAVSIVGLVSMAVGLATDPVGAVALLGVVAQTYPAGKGLVRQLGYAPATFTGEQWPFLYAYGSEANRKSLEQLRFILDEA
jgi:hypothetical protein